MPKVAPAQRPVENGAPGDRRSAIRYPLHFEMLYRLREKDTVVAEGLAWTRDISRRAVFWEAPGQICSEPAIAELSISWPATLRLSVFGNVLRCDERGIAVQIGRYLIWRPTPDDVKAGLYWPQALRSPAPPKAASGTA